MNQSIKALTIATAMVLSGCGPSDPPLEFELQGDRFVLNGVIDERAVDAFDRAITAAPSARTLVFDFVPGSLDDDSNIELARLIRERDFTTVILSDGLVASGGTDLFLAGTSRNIAAGACVGVHTWGDDENVIGADLPKDDPVHDIYLDYYQDMGIDPQFYWFTLDAAGIDESHWMSREEIRGFQLISATESPLISAPSGIREKQCEMRLERGLDSWAGY